MDQHKSITIPNMRYIYWLAILYLTLVSCQPQFLSPITILDGEQIHILTTDERIPANLLVETGITLAPVDQVLGNGLPLPLEQPLPPEFHTLQIRRAVTVRVFASKGYHDTKVDDIVSQSQTSKGSFYFYFPSKQDIFLVLVDTFADLLESRLRDRLSTEPSGTARVEAVLRVCLETFGQYRSLAKIALVQATGLGAAFEQKRQAVNQRFIEIVREKENPLT